MQEATRKYIEWRAEHGPWEDSLKRLSYFVGASVTTGFIGKGLLHSDMPYTLAAILGPGFPCAFHAVHSRVVSRRMMEAYESIRQQLDDTAAAMSDLSQASDHPTMERAHRKWLESIKALEALTQELHERLRVVRDV